MSKITKLTTTSLGMIIKLLLDLFLKTKHTELLGSKQYIAFAVEAQGYLNSLNKVESSLYTPDVATREKRRDTSIAALYKTVKGLTTAPVAGIKEAANRIEAVLKVHGTSTSICGLKQGDKTPVIDSLLAQVASSISADDIAILNLAPWIDDIAQAQADYLAIYVQRSSSNASEANIAPASLQRPQLEKSLTALMKYIDAKVTLDADPFWHGISNEVEELITEMANTQRVKSRTPKKEKGEGKPTPGE